MNLQNSDTSINQDFRDYITNGIEEVLYVKGFSNLHETLASKGYEIKPIKFNEQVKETKNDLIIVDFTPSSLENKIEIKSWTLIRLGNKKQN